MSSYHQEQERKNKLKLREIEAELPPFMNEFFRNRADHTSSRTRLGYAYDMRLFFNYLRTDTFEFGGKTVHNFTLEDMGKITNYHIEEFLDYLSVYNKGGDGKDIWVENRMEGKSRKLSAIRSVFAYFYKRGKVAANPAELVDTPPTKEKAKVYLDVDEIANLIDMADHGVKMTNHQKKFHTFTRSRDVALLSLFSGTGIRISECVGLNIEDIDLKKGSFKVTRKGGNEEILHFNEEIEKALQEYLDERMLKKPLPGHERALFLSIQNRRITDRAVQNLVKKYSQMSNSLKTITPHKLRTSFGTNMYRQTGDIYLVADLLGHKDVNTTRKNYADTKQDAGRRAVRNLRLRGDD
ncbi:MAG: tyrosine-type recombinase/integrase [Defluviitaleaceae bacterium]|nr:tyrosine-type recombinase/integrase [Defluviitaleaceae bacterium]